MASYIRKQKTIYNRNFKMISEIQKYDNNNLNHFNKLTKYSINEKKTIDTKKIQNIITEISDLLLNSNYLNEYQYSNIFILLKSIDYFLSNMKYSTVINKFVKFCNELSFDKEECIKDNSKEIYRKIEMVSEDMLTDIYSNHYNNLPLYVIKEVNVLRKKVKSYYKNVIDEDEKHIFGKDILLIEKTLSKIDKKSNNYSSDSSDTNSDIDYDYDTFDNIDQDIKNNIIDDVSMYDDYDTQSEDYDENQDNELEIKDDNLPKKTV